MGVPKFFRFISERWPLISKLIDEDQIPEFDNLYLDMNSILHTATRASGQNYDDILEAMDNDDEMYGAIFEYIDHLFNTIKPKKVFYMAIDGVAPRAKMNQQRSRRFRTALEAEKARKLEEEEAALTGSIVTNSLNSKKVFDSNSITPGTEFMATLTKHLKFYIHKKVTTDVNWQNIDVIFSGHEVPGEGEHKIMQYIRNMKLQKNYNVNTRHCIYGLDADLIMLGLVTHDTHFALLREEVTFGRQTSDKGGSTIQLLNDQKFYLLHLSLVREYLQLEFEGLANILPFNYDFERILDDFILILYVIGNDFLPNLPDLHINKGAFPFLLKTFKRFLISSDGYLNDNGKINFTRLKGLFEYLSLFEYENFENGKVDVNWFNKKLDDLSLHNENKKKLLGIQKRRYAEQTAKLEKLSDKKIQNYLKNKKASNNAFDILNSEETDSENTTGDQSSDIGKFIKLDPSQNFVFSKIFTFVEPWLLRIFVNPETYALYATADEDEIPILNIPQNFVPNNSTLQFSFLKQIAADFQLLVLENLDESTVSLKLDTMFVDTQEGEEIESRISKFAQLIDTKYAPYFAKVSDELMTDVMSELNISENHDVQMENLSTYLEDDKFVSWKNSYYTEKFGFTLQDKEKSDELIHNYLEGLQWVLFYYYNGVTSWSWYYKYYFAPRISDIFTHISDDVKITYPKDKPFTPFQQLMGVLPARSNLLLPAVYRPLLLKEDSPIIDFYPSEVEIDKNGKTVEWEYVFKLSFVDQDRLVSAMKPFESKLTEEERKRNSCGKDLIFIFNPQNDKRYLSTMPQSFDSIAADKCIEKVFHLPEIPNDCKITFNHLLKGAKVGKDMLADFPTLETLPYSSELLIDFLEIFNQASKSESMVLKLDNQKIISEYISEMDENIEIDIEAIAKMLLNKIIYVGWPYLKEAKVVSISDGNYDYCNESGKNAKKLLNDQLNKLFKDKLKQMIHEAHIKRGIKIGKVSIIIKTVSTNGVRRDPNSGAYFKTFSRNQEEYPLQLVVHDVVNKDPRFLESPPKPIEEEFPIGCHVTFLGDLAYGCDATVVGHDSKTELKLHVASLPRKEIPADGKRCAFNEKTKIKFYKGSEAASLLGIHPIFFSRICSKFMIVDSLKNQKKFDIGMDLKFESKKLKVLGYTKKENGVWLYSDFAVSLIHEYRSKFPKFFKHLMLLSRNRSREMLEVNELFPHGTQELDVIISYLESKKQGFNTVSLTSEFLSRSSIAIIEKSISEFVIKPHKPVDTVLNHVPTTAVLNTSRSASVLKSQKFSVGDRIVNVSSNSQVPLFAQGTVVGIQIDELSGNIRVSLYVIFDYPLINGNRLSGRLRSNRGMVVESGSVLNLTDKQRVYHSKASSNKSSALKEKRQTKKQEIKEKQIEKKKERDEHAHAILKLLKKDAGDEANKDEKQAEEEEKSVSDDQALNISDVTAQKLHGQIMQGLNGLNGPPRGSFPLPHQSFPPPPFGMIPLGHIPPGGMPHIPPPPFGMIPVGQMVPPPLPPSQQQSYRNSTASKEVSDLLKRNSKVSTGDEANLSTHDGNQSKQNKHRGGHRGRGGNHSRGRGGHRGRGDNRGRGDHK